MSKAKRLVRRLAAVCMAMIAAVASVVSAFATEGTPTPFPTIDYQPIADGMASAMNGAVQQAVPVVNVAITAAGGILAIYLMIRLGLYIYRRITSARG